MDYLEHPESFVSGHVGVVNQVMEPADWAYSKAVYYPFGMKFMNSFSGSNPYRYGYQGEYAEDETEEEGVQANSFQLRLYNPRLGRWLSPDPYEQYHSPYLAMGNNPINGVDPGGGLFKTWKLLRNGKMKEVDQIRYFRDSDGKISNTYTKGATEVDKVIGVGGDGVNESIYINMVRTLDGNDVFSFNIKYENNVGVMVEGKGIRFDLKNDHDSKKFIEFSYRTTDVEFQYTHSHKVMTIGKETQTRNYYRISTIHSEGSSVGTSILKPGSVLLYSVHTHPGGNYKPSGTITKGDMPEAGQYDKVIFQIFSGEENGYTTYNHFGILSTDNPKNR